MAIDIQMMEGFKADLQSVCAKHDVDAAFFIFCKGDQLYGANVKACNTPATRFLEILTESNLDALKSFSGK